MVKIKKLNCGVTVAMEKMPHLKSVSLGIWVKAGAVNENKKNAGISHFIEHMMFKGTKERTAKEIAESVDCIGGQINAFTGKEATCYYIKTLASNIDKSMDILMDMFLNSLFDKKEMEREKMVIFEEMKMVQDSPDEDAHDTICEEVFKGLPLGNSILGNKTSLKGIKRDTIKEYIKNQYTRDSIVVSVAGNFDEEALCDSIEGKLSVLEAKKEPLETIKKEYTPNFKVKVKNNEQTHLCIGIPSINLDDDRYYAFSLLNNIMGGSMSSRFFQGVREQKGLAYSVYSMNSSFTNMGYYNIYAGIAHDKVKETIEAIKYEFNLLKKDGVTAEELAKSKEQLKSGYIFGQENVNSRMFAIGKNTLLLGRVTPVEEVLENIDKVTAEDIVEVEKIICNINKYSGAIITNKKINLDKYIRG